MLHACKSKCRCTPAGAVGESRPSLCLCLCLCLQLSCLFFLPCPSPWLATWCGASAPPPDPNGPPTLEAKAIRPSGTLYRLPVLIVVLSVPARRPSCFLVLDHKGPSSVLPFSVSVFQSLSLSLSLDCTRISLLCHAVAVRLTACTTTTLPLHRLLVLVCLPRPIANLPALFA